MPKLDEREKQRMSKLLRACRDGLGLSQQEVANYLRVERSTYAKYEGGRVPDLATLLELAALYRIEFAQFTACFKKRKQVTDLRKLSNTDVIIREDNEYLPLSEDEKRLLAYYRNSIRKNVISDAAKAVMLEDASGPWFAEPDDDDED